MNDEHDLREALTLLERLAPEQLPALDQTGEGRRPDGRRRLLLAAAASAACIIAVAVTIALTHGATRPATVAPAPTALAAAKGGPVGSFGCPPALGSPAATWVPAKPSGVNTTGRLAPAQTPTSITVCAFVGQDSPLPRSGVMRMGGDFTQAAQYLSTIGPTRYGLCTADIEQGDRDQFLVHLTFPHGSVWLTVAGDHCGGASNGTFTTSAILGRTVTSWFTSGRASSPAPEVCGGRSQGTGRVGQDAHMVPDSPTSVDICSRGAPLRHAITGSELAGLIRALNDEPASPAIRAGSCTPTGSTSLVHDYSLIFRYRYGTSADVLVISGCNPEVQNGTLQITTAPAVLALVTQLAASH